LADLLELAFFVLSRVLGVSSAGVFGKMLAQMLAQMRRCIERRSIWKDQQG
jgi:hypothetical protein